MVTNLFKPLIDPSPIPDPYAKGGLRVWDDYQFLRKGVKGAGGGQSIHNPDLIGPPVNVVLPVIMETVRELHCPTGTWHGTRPIRYDYQWFRSEIIVPPVPTPPVNTFVPIITGTPTETFTLSCPRGTWSGSTPIAYGYQWFRTEAPEVPTPPSLTTAPAVSGSLIAGSTLHSTSGSWAGTAPITYHYQWTKLPSTLVGTDSADYATSPADVGASFTCTVTAVNAVGEASQVSNTKGPMVEAPPAEVLTTEGVALTVDGEVLTT